MKILLVLEQFDVANNGTTITAIRLATVLKKHGHEVRVASSGESRDDKYGFSIIKVPIFDSLIKKQGMVFARPVEKKLREAVDWADIVHIMMPFMLERKAVMLCRELGKPYTGAFHVQPENIWFSVKLGNFKPLISLTYFVGREYIFKYFNYIHCPSRMISDQLVKHHYKAELRIISNGIDPDFIYHKEEKSPELKGKFVIVMSGRFSHEKRQDILIDAVKKSKHEKDIQLFLAGQGPVEAGYRKRAKGLTNPIIMHFLTRDQLICLFGQTDLYVHASDIDIEAMSCMEAFASGLVPIISDSRRSATSQFALDERSIFSAGDSIDLAEKIDYWFEHENERRKMEVRYAEHAKNYTLESCVCQMEEMFTDEIRKRNIEESH